jgi:hypothetical protein
VVSYAALRAATLSSKDASLRLASVVNVNKQTITWMDADIACKEQVSDIQCESEELRQCMYIRNPRNCMCA